MSKTTSIVRKIEVVANVCIVMTAVAFVGSIGFYFLRYYSSFHRQRSSIQRGARLTLPDIDWSMSPRTLLLVLSTECKYCSASAPFYRRIVNQAELTHTTRLVAIFPQQINISREYLADQNVKIDTLRQALPASLGAKGTPTLILVGSDGLVIESWDGMVPTAVESEILESVK